MGIASLAPVPRGAARAGPRRAGKKSGRQSAPGRPAALGIRSLERGLSILRLFTPGVSVRGNSEIAELTGLPRSTVSRLTQTLVACRFLEYDRVASAYRLGAVVLGLSEALLAASDVLDVAAPLMQEASRRLGANVTLAVADGEEMVFVHSIRAPENGVSRRVTTGHRIPIEATALGRAYLATLSPYECATLMSGLSKRHPAARWRELREQIDASIQQARTLHYCHLNWLPGIRVAATAVEIPGRATHVIGMGVPSKLYDEARIAQELGPEVMGLARKLRLALERSGTNTA